MSSISAFEELVKESHVRLEREGVALKSTLRELRTTNSQELDLDQISELLKGLKKLKSPVEDMIKFLEDVRVKVTDTEVHMYETIGVESRSKAGRTTKGENNDSGIFSADSRVFTDRSSTLVTQPCDTTEEDFSEQTSRPEPTQHEDTSKPRENDGDSIC